MAQNLTTIPPTRHYCRNHSTGSMNETGSLDRMKAAAERRKKGMDETGPTVSVRVEGTRVNPDSLIDEILKNSKLDQLEESAESECRLRCRVNFHKRLLTFRNIYQLPVCNCISPATEPLRWAAMRWNRACPAESSSRSSWRIPDSWRSPIPTPPQNCWTRTVTLQPFRIIFLAIR